MAIEQMKDEDGTFSAEEFLNNLKKDKPFDYLKDFISRSRDTDEEDVVKEFIQYASTKDCSEIFSLLSTKRTTSELTTIFETLQEIFLRIASDMKSYSSWALTIIRRLLQADNLRQVYRALSTGNSSSGMIVTLTLLTSMVMSSSLAAKEVLSHLILDKNKFGCLLTRIDIKNVKDVRACTIDLLISFMMSGSSQITRQFLETNEIINVVFQELPNDKCPTIETFLRAITSQVINDDIVSKTLKVRLLNHRTLSYVFQLFKWKGAKKYEKRLPKKSERLTDAEKEAGGEAVVASTEKEVEAVHQLAYEFLITVCCSLKHGIIFRDKYMGTRSNVNANISMLLSNVEKPFTKPLEEAVIAEILKSCPDQIFIYFLKLSEFVHPRPSDHWYATMSFITKVFSELDLMKIIDIANTSEAIPKVVQMFLNVSCTTSLSRSVLKDILTSVHLPIRHHGICYIEVVLTQMNKLVNENEAVCKRLKSKISKFHEFKKQLCLKIFKILPAAEDLTVCWELVTKAGVAHLEEDLTDDSLRGFSLCDHLKTLLNCLAMYLQFLPDAFDFSSTQQAKLLITLENLSLRLPADDMADIQIKILKLMGENMKGKCLLLEKIKHSNVASVLFGILKNSKDFTTRKVALELLKQMLISTTAFLTNEDELDIWLRQLLMRLERDNHDNALDFFKDICETIASQPKVYMEQTNSFILEMDKSSGNDEEDAYNRLFDALMDDNSMALVDEDFDESNRFKVFGLGAFSPLITVAFHLMKTKKYAEEIADIVADVSQDLLHTRVNPEPFRRLLEQHTEHLPNQLKRYLKFFQVKRVKKESPTKRMKKCSDVRLIARESFISGTAQLNAICKEDLQKMIENCSRVELFMLSQEILTFLHYMFQNENLADDNLSSSYYSVLELIIALKLDDNTDDIFPYFCQNVAELFLQRPFVQIGFLSDSQTPLTNLILATLNRHPNIKTSTKLIYQNAVEDFVMKSISSVEHRSLNLSQICQPFLSDFSSQTLAHFVYKLSKFPVADFASKKRRYLRKFLITVLNRVAQVVSPLPYAVISAEILRKLFEMTVEMKDVKEADELLESLTEITEMKPIYCLAVSEKVASELIQQMDKECTLNLFRNLCLYSADHLHTVEKYLMELDEFEDRLLTLIFSYLEAVQRFPCKSDDCNVLLTKLANYVWPLVISSIRDDDDDDDGTKLDQSQLTLFLDLFSNYNFMEVDDLLQFCNQCSASILNSAMASEMLRQTKWIYEQLSVSGQLVNNYNTLTMWVYNWLRTILTSLANSSENSFEKTALDVEFLTNSVEAIEKLPDLGRILHQEKVWHRLIKTFLKLAIRDKNGSCLLNLLKAVLKKLKLNGELWSIHCTSIYSLVNAHSNFIPAILDSSKAAVQWKTDLIDFLTLLVECEKSCCESAHVPLFLSAYGASLSLLDQKILRLIYLYEENGIDVHSFKPFMWGSAAIGHYSVSKNISHSLWKQPTMEEVLNLLDKDLIIESAFKFNLQLPLHPTVFEIESGFQSLYDPRFLQSLLSNLLAPASLVNCMKFIDCNCLPFLLSSLSSEDSAMRSAAYHNLSLFYQHLEGSRYRKKSQWLLMLNCLMNSIVVDNLRLPTLITVFLVRCCQHIQNPADPMSHPIINFLMLKPQLDIENVPEFITFFNTVDVKDHELHRCWMLAFLGLGFRCNLDYVLCRKRHVFKLTMAYFYSPLASDNGRLLVLEFFKQAATVSKVALNLVNIHGLFNFISSALAHKNEEITSLCIDIICNVWNVNTTEMFIVSETLSVLLPISSINVHLSLKTFEKYLKVLASCLSAAEKLTRGLPRRLNTVYLTNLMKIYNEIVEGTATDISQQNLKKSCANSLCDIIMKWKCDQNEETFAKLLEFISKNVEVDVQSGEDKVLEMYKWLEETMKQLPSSAISSTVLKHMFRCYEQILFTPTSGVKLGRKAVDLNAINSLFNVVLQKLSSGKPNDSESNTLIDHLSSKTVQKLLQTSDFSKLIYDCDSHLKSFIVGIGACELLLLSDNMEKFDYCWKSCQILSTKRKSKESKENAKKQKKHSR